MMKKEMKKMNIGTRCVLMLAVVFGLLMSSCYTKNDIAPVPEVETIDNIYIISGQIFDSETNAFLSNVTITCNPAATSIEQVAGTFQIRVASGQTYTLTFAKDGYESKEGKVIVPTATASTGQMIMVPILVHLNKIKTPSTPTNANVTVANGGIVTTNNASLSFLANTVSKDTTVGMTVNYTVNPLSNNNHGAAFVLGTFTPSGLVFSQAAQWNVAASVLTNHYVKNIVLQHRANATSAWNNETNQVFYDQAKGNYFTFLTHFSEYQMVYNYESMNEGEIIESAIEITPIENTGIQMVIDSVEVAGAYKEGHVEMEFISEEEVSEDIKTLITAVIESSLPFQAVNFDGLKEQTKVGIPEVTLPTNYRFKPTGTQRIDEYHYTFKFYSKDDNTEHELRVRVSVPSEIIINVSEDAFEYMAPHHSDHVHGDHVHGDHASNGGAGGGAAVN